MRYEYINIKVRAVVVGDFGVHLIEPGRKFEYGVSHIPTGAIVCAALTEQLGIEIANIINEIDIEMIDGYPVKDDIRSVENTLKSAFEQGVDFISIGVNS